MPYDPRNIRDPWNTRWEDMDTGFRIIFAWIWTMTAAAILLPVGVVIAWILDR